MPPIECVRLMIFRSLCFRLFEKPITKNEVRDILKKEGLSANEEQLNKLVDNCMKADILQLIR